MSTSSWNVTGLTCGHCVGAVTKELASLAGVESVQVELVPQGESMVTVVSAHALDEATVRGAIDEAGFDLVGATP